MPLNNKRVDDFPENIIKQIHDTKNCKVGEELFNVKFYTMDFFIKRL